MKKSFKNTCLLVLPLLICSSMTFSQNKPGFRQDKIDLSGEWRFQMDSTDVGITEQWYNRKLTDKVTLPGSMTTNGKGNDITLHTPWTGQIVDSSWFFKPEYARYRQPGNIKIPFWLQPVKYYKGAAWYQKTVSIPQKWKGKPLELFIERSHWETTVWVDNKEIGMQNSLATQHIFDLSKALSPGKHQISIRVDNRVKDINVGQNSHSISDHTQSNWNGMIGQLYLAACPAVYLADVQIFPDLKKNQITVHLEIINQTGKPVKANIDLLANPLDPKAQKLKPYSKITTIVPDTSHLEIIYSMGDKPLLWDEFHPHLYALKVNVNTGEEIMEEKMVRFGMREFATRGTQFTINGRLTFLRGTLECAIFPKTGFPPTDVASWSRIFKICRSYGLNHMRFHSWCPPEAAFAAADLAGFYLQIECDSWANQGATIGDGRPLDQYIYEESRRITKAYGNHPSFCMLTYGNEPAGKNHVSYLTNFVNYWEKTDSRRLYTSAAGWPVIKESNYNSTPDPRIQGWGEGLKSIINGKPPASDFDWAAKIAKWQHPTVSHEIGQWCVYPDFKEISKYTGVLKAKNFEIFRNQLQNNGLIKLADSFLLASGKLQALCYKADIEAALRTPGFGGFQLLDLHDFPGQGTALVGVLNPFWEDKGYITGKEYSRFCNAVVPLARLPKMIYTNNEALKVPIEIANFGAAALENITPAWQLTDEDGKLLSKATLATTTIPVGNGFKLGEIRQSLTAITQARRLTLTVSAGKAENSWEIFVYPAVLPAIDNIVVTQNLEAEAMETLQKGGKVLLTLKKGTLLPAKGGGIKIGFSSIFWNTAWTGGQPPTTLGILANPAHPAFKNFPTQYHSGWQWWDAMSHSNAIILDSVAKGLQPLVRVIDDWVTARSLGLVFECRVGKGKLIVSGIDLLSDQENRPEARQLLYSLKKYMDSPEFTPGSSIGIEQIKALTE